MTKVGGYKKIIIIATLFLLSSLFLTGKVDAQARPLGLSDADWITVNQNQIADYERQLAILNQNLTRLRGSDGQSTGIADEYGNVSTIDNSEAIRNTKEQIDHLNSEIAIRQRNIAEIDLTNNPTIQNQAALDNASQNVRNNLQQEQQTLQANPNSVQSREDPGETYCSFSAIGLGGGLWKCLLWVLAAILNIVSVAFISVIMTISGWMLDLSIYYSVVNMGAILGASGVVFVWSIARDLSNMALIFVLLYTAFNIIIESTSSGNAKKLIVNVIIVALLVNFSGFFVRAATDVSNAVAYEFYKAIVPKNVAAQSIIGSVSWGFIGNSQAWKFWAGRSQSAQTTGEESWIENNSKNLSLTKIFGDFIFDLLFGGISFFVFIYLAILFILRIITITAVFMFSPILVLAYAVPGIKGTASKWQKNLTNQLIFAPAMMFFLYATVMMMKKGVGFDSEDSMGVLGGIWGNSLGSAIYYIIVMGILIKSVGWAKGIADISGKTASQITGSVVGGAQSLGGWAVGKAAKSPTGKNLSNKARNWYNSDRFGAKAARAFGRSDVGQAAGEFAKKPLANTAERFKLSFVDKSSAEKWGNMIETAQKAKEKQIEQRAFGPDDKKFNDEKVLMNFLEMNEKDQAHAYSKMNEKQRGLVDHVLSTGDAASREKIIDGILFSEKLDKASVNAITDPADKAEAERKAAEMKQKTADKLDKLIGTQADAATAIANEKAAKTAEAAAAANPNDSVLRKAADTARAAANTSAQHSSIVRIASNVSKAKTSLSGKEKGEVTKARRTIENKATSSVGKNVAKELINNTGLSVDDTTWDPKHPAPGIARVNAIRSISNDDIVELFESDPDKFIGPEVTPGTPPVDNFVKFLTSKQMKALSESSTITKPQFATIIEKLRYYKDKDPKSAGDQDVANTILYIDKNPDKF